MSCDITLRKEIEPRNVGFNLDSVDVMVRSQWQSKPKSILYLLYRWVFAVFLVNAVGMTVHAYARSGRFLSSFIYFTNAGIQVDMVAGVIGAVLVTIWHFGGFKESVLKNGKMPTVFKIYWATHNIALVTSIILTITFWPFLWDGKRVGNVNTLTHILNSVVMFLDHLIVAHPLRLYHVIQPICFFAFYVLFTIIYYLCGGVDFEGKHYIYELLDWANPGTAFFSCFCVIIMMIPVHAFLFGVYRLRVFVHRKYFSAKIKPTGRTVSNQIYPQLV